MKNIKNINKIVLSFVAATLISCKGILVPDPIDPQLPKYTEEGNSVAGAYINNEVWQSVEKYFGFSGNYAPSVTAWPRGDSLSVKFEGEVLSQVTTIEFHLRGLHIFKFEDLLQLNDKKIQIDGVRYSGYYIKYFYPGIYANKSAGQIYFRNVTRKEERSWVTFSGTFGFSVNETGGKTTKISYGRFDYKLWDNSNFHVE